MAEFISPQANLRAQQRSASSHPNNWKPKQSSPQSRAGQNYYNIPSSGKQFPAQSRAGRNYNNVQNRGKQLSKRRTSIKESKEALTVFLDGLLQKAWLMVFVTYGLSLIWVFIHGIIRYIGGSKIFPPFGSFMGKVLPSKDIGETMEKILAGILFFVFFGILFLSITMLITFILLQVAPFKIAGFLVWQKIWTVVESLFSSAGNTTGSTVIPGR